MANQDLKLEMRIVISFITNTTFCKQVFPVYDPEFLSNDFAKKVVGWCKIHFEKYGKAPNTKMESIYYEKENSLEEPDREIISNILDNLSNLEDKQDKSDTQYDIDLALKCFQKRKLQLTGETVAYLTSIDSVQEALDLQKEYKEISIIHDDQPSFYDPSFAIELINKLDSPEDRSSNILALGGRFGEFVGPLEGGWLFSVMAPPKRGKSFLLQDVALTAVRNRIKTLFVSLEMSPKDMGPRFVQSVTACRRHRTVPTKMIPVFDCVSNQNAKCGLAARPVQEVLKLIEDEKKDPKLAFHNHKKHIPCTTCRGQVIFQPTSWFEVCKEITSKDKMLKQYGAWNPQFNSFLRTRAYSASTTRVSTILNYMEQLRDSGFLIKVLVIDYADLIAADDSRKDYRFQLDQIWKDLKAIANDWGILVFTASQANREGMRSSELESLHAAEDIKKINISDGFLGMNQSREEKARGLMKINFLDARHTSRSGFCYILQDLAHGQFCLDSEF